MQAIVESEEGFVYTVYCGARVLRSCFYRQERDAIAALLSDTDANTDLFGIPVDTSEHSFMQRVGDTEVHFSVVKVGKREHTSQGYALREFFSSHFSSEPIRIPPPNLTRSGTPPLVMSSAEFDRFVAHAGPGWIRGEWTYDDNGKAVEVETNEK